jgi:DNA (cytosine-5)-methyltransferase 1
VPADIIGIPLDPAKPRAHPGITVVDLFAGAGGLSEGFRQAGYRVIGGAEIDPDAAATYARNFPEAETVVGDLRSPEVHSQISSIAESATVVVGGPPCQAWSQIRNHSRYIDDPRNSLYKEFVQVVAGALPLGFVMENVTGLDQMGVRKQILADLTLEGEYRVHAQVVDAANFGVPQTRERLLFIGVHRLLGCEPPVLKGTNATARISLQRNLKAAATYTVVAQEDALVEGVAEALADDDDVSVVTVAQAISDLAMLPVGNRRDVLPYHSFPAPDSAYQRMMRTAQGQITNVQVPRINEDTHLRLSGIPQGGNHRDLSEALLGRYLTGKRWGQDNGTGRLSRRHYYAYRRLHPSIWAWTLNTKADSVYHYAVPRALSVREFARLQSFPDSFEFTTDPRKGPLPYRIGGGPGHSRYRQVGNAVPPLLARAAANALQPLILRALETRRQTA